MIWEFVKTYLSIKVDKLYAGLKDLANERRAKLDDALKLFRLNREVDDLEQWIAEKEVTFLNLTLKVKKCTNFIYKAMCVCVLCLCPNRMSQKKRREGNWEEGKRGKEKLVIKDI